ncbi:MAG: hypothetical protein ACXWP6_05885 [Ktedonobacterales bacterium]
MLMLRPSPLFHHFHAYTYLTIPSRASGNHSGYISGNSIASQPAQSCPITVHGGGLRGEAQRSPQARFQPPAPIRWQHHQQRAATVPAIKPAKPAKPAIQLASHHTVFQGQAGSQHTHRQRLRQKIGNISGNGIGHYTGHTGNRHNTANSHLFPNSSRSATNTDHSGKNSGNKIGKTGNHRPLALTARLARGKNEFSSSDRRKEDEESTNFRRETNEKNRNSTQSSTPQRKFPRLLTPGGSLRSPVPLLRTREDRPRERR